MEDLIADIGIGGAGAEAGGQVHHGHVGGGNAEGHAGHLALQGGDHTAHGLGRAGGGGDDVVEDGAAGAPVAAAAGVHRLLLGGGGVDGGHQGLLDAEGLMYHIGQRCQTVGGAAGVGDHLHVGAVLVAVDAVDKGGGGVVLGGGGEDDLFRAALEVAAGFIGGVVGAGGFDDILRLALAPLDHGGIGFAEHLDLMAVDDQVAAGVLHHAGEVAEHGVVFQQIHHIVDIRLAEVDAADVEGLRIFAHNAQDNTSDPAEAVDADLDCHIWFSFPLSSL